MDKAKLIDIMKSCSDSSQPFRIDNHELDLETGTNVSAGIELNCSRFLR